jgi:hypothetical protein
MSAISNYGVVDEIARPVLLAPRACSRRAPRRHPRQWPSGSDPALSRVGFAGAALMTTEWHGIRAADALGMSRGGDTA